LLDITLGRSDIFSLNFFRHQSIKTGSVWLGGAITLCFLRT